MKELSVIFFSSFKFAMTFPLAILEYNMGIAKTIILTNIGGLLGIFFFSYLSDLVIHLWKNHLAPYLKKFFSLKEPLFKKRKKKKFTKRNRRIINIRTKYGLIGIAFATPILLSIPVGAFLVVRFFGKKPIMLSYLAGANVLWSVIFTVFYTFLFEIYLKIFPGT